MNNVSLNNALNHLKTINKHKKIVMEGCFKVGLYRQGLLHDLSKYMPTEFLTGVRYYQGTRSPNTAEVEHKGYSEAWLHHKGRNKHHFEYWIDFSVKDTDKLRIAKMPTRYVVEMFIDRISACKVYNGEHFDTWDAWHYYNRGDTGRFLHPDTKKLLEHLLVMYGQKGEAYTFRYIRKKILKNI